MILAMKSMTYNPWHKAPRYEIEFDAVVIRLEVGMKTARQKAGEWVNENVVLAEHCDIEYSDLIEKLELLLKEQDRDTRHLAAERVNRLALDDNTIRTARSVVMDARAV